MSIKLSERDLSYLKVDCSTILRCISYQVAAKAKAKFPHIETVAIGSSAWTGFCTECHHNQFDTNHDTVDNLKVIISQCRGCDTVHALVPWHSEHCNQLFSQLVSVIRWTTNLLESSQSELDVLEVAEGSVSLEHLPQLQLIQDIRISFKSPDSHQRMLDLEA